MSGIHDGVQEPLKRDEGPVHPFQAGIKTPIDKDWGVQASDEEPL